MKSPILAGGLGDEIPQRGDALCAAQILNTITQHKPIGAIFAKIESLFWHEHSFCDIRSLMNKP